MLVYIACGGIAQGEFKEAVKWNLSALALNPHYFPALYHLGLCLHLQVCVCVYVCVCVCVCACVCVCVCVQLISVVFWAETICICKSALAGATCLVC